MSRLHIFRPMPAMSSTTSSFILVLVLVLSAVQLVAADGDSMTDGDRVACVYQLSGAYAPVARYSYYALLLFGIVARHETWLIAGALVSAMTFSGTTAIHAIILSATLDSQAFDLDTAGAWAVLSAGVFALWPVLQISSTLRRSPYRPIFGVWAVLVCMGLVALSVPVYISKWGYVENACRSSTGVLLSQPSDLGPGAPFGCSYSCFGAHRLLRGPNELYAIPVEQIFGSKYDMFRAMAGFVTSAACTVTVLFAYSAGWCGRRTPRPLRCGTAQGNGVPSSRKFTFFSRANRAPSNLSAASVDSPSPFRSEKEKEKEASKQKWKEYKRRPWEEQTIQDIPVSSKRRVVWFFFGLNQLSSLTTIALSEVYLLGAGLPEDEQPYAISQWGSLVAILLAVVAAIMSKYIQVNRIDTKRAAARVQAVGPLQLMSSGAHSATAAAAAALPMSPTTLVGSCDASLHAGGGPSFVSPGLASTKTWGTLAPSVPDVDSEQPSFFQKLKLVFRQPQDRLDDLEALERPTLKRHPTW